MATNKKPTDKTPAKPGVFDIAKPGRSGLPASANSRSVITGNRPVMQDPMMASKPPEADNITTPKLTPTRKVVIQPLHESLDDTSASATPEPAPAAPVIEPIIEEPDAKPVTAETAGSMTVEPPSTAGVPGEGEDRDAKAKLAHERATELQKMIEAEQYFLPINSVEERRSRRIAIVGLLLIVVLAAAWYDVALDAGLMPNIYNLPHSSFFTVK